MMAYQYSVLSILAIELGFITVVWLTASNKRFLGGELKEIINWLIAGILFLYGAVFTQFLIEVYEVYGSPLEIFKYSFMLVAFLYFFVAAKRIDELSKVLGFAYEKLPSKLKKVLGKK